MTAMLLAVTKDARKLLEFGSAVGIAIGATDLEVVVARVRPSGATARCRPTRCGR